ncbi:MAG: RCC1-like domain-containing protein [Chloroflexota bacterium]
MIHKTVVRYVRNLLVPALCAATVLVLAAPALVPGTTGTLSAASDPWLSFLGGSNDDRAKDLTVDEDGNTSSWGDPVEAFSANEDAFVAKLDAGQTVGEVWATGANEFGQLGDGTSSQRSTPVQVLLPGDVPLSGVVAIAAGDSHSLALLADGTVRAWGMNNHGQLGNDSNDDSNVPVEVSDLTDVTAIAAGYSHCLAVKADGTVWSWGYNSYGQLGNGSNDNSSVPVQVSGLTGVTAVAAGSGHSLAVKSDGTLWTWGWNWEGQLGDGSSGADTNRNTPYQVSGLSSVVAAAGGEHHSLALLADGTVWAWGFNPQGQLGNGNYEDKLTPVYVIDGRPANKLSGVSAIAAGKYHSLALKSDGTVLAWGCNWYGQLGDDSTTDSPQYVQVTGLGDVAGVAAGCWHSLALKTDGTVWGWGSGSNGRLAIGTNSSQVKVPEEMLDMSDALALAGGRAHTLILRTPAEDTSVSMDLDLKPGWNMVSVPVTADDMSTSAVFPGVEAVYTWDPTGKSYTVPSTIEPHKGYWVAVTAEQTVPVTGVTGEPVTEWTSGVSRGWNMVGSVHGITVDFSNPADEPDGSCEGFVYTWNPGSKSYEYCTSIEPGKGYWAAATADGDLTLGPPV